MPMYLYKCPTCAGTLTVFKKIAEMDTPTHCLSNAHAGQVQMIRQIVAPMVKGDYPGYSCPITGKWIEGRRAHEENLAKHGCRVLESGEKEEVMRRRKSDEEAFDKSVDETVEQFVETLPHDKRERLQEEVEHGFDAVVVRN